MYGGSYFLCAARTAWRGRANHAVELSTHDGHLEDRARPGCGQHDRAQASRDHAGIDSGARTVGGRGSACWGVEHCPRRRGGAGQLLAEHTTPAMVSVTGSVRAGQQVAASAVEGLKRTHLELGGKAPAVVFGDADLSKAAESVIAFGTFNAGQDCTAITRIIVVDSVHDELVELLAAQARKVTTGEQDDAKNDFGPLNNGRHFSAVCEKLKRMPDRATVVTGGLPSSGATGFFIEPTIVTGVRQDDELLQEETFAPVLTVQAFSSEEEAIELANGVEYALASSVWTSNHARAMRFTRVLDFGCVWVNTHLLLVAEMPHGGFKASGYGKDLSGYSVDEYTQVKHIMHALD